MSSIFTKPGSGEGAGGGSTVIARGVKVEGNFVSPGDVLIEGEVQGTLQAGGMLTIGTDASIKADITAGEAFVAGSIEGNTVASGKLELKSSAKVVGDITAQTLVIEAGAVLAGRVSVGMKTAAEPRRLGTLKRESLSSVPATS